MYIKDVFTISFIMSFLGDNVIMLDKGVTWDRRGLAYTPFYYTHMNWFIKNDKNQSHKLYFFWEKIDLIYEPLHLNLDFYLSSILNTNVIMCLTKVSLENRRGLAYTPFWYTHMNWFIKNKTQKNRVQDRSIKCS